MYLTVYIVLLLKLCLYITLIKTSRLHMFADANKAFDRVKHRTQFAKL